MAPLSLYHPLKGKMWKIGNRRLIETPVSVILFFRIPFHMAYIYTSHAKLFDIGFFLTRKSGSLFNYVLHGTELIDESKNSLFPSQFLMDTPVEKRLKIYKAIFLKTSNYYNIISSENLINKFMANSKKYGLKNNLK
tara:strand:+ start:1360 stop:1770 length:411 start_codon:yes stop_codon:yes gene_type:complete